MHRSGSELDSQGVQALQHRVVARLGTGRQCLVKKAFTPQARVFGELRHARARATRVCARESAPLSSRLLVQGLNLRLFELSRLPQVVLGLYTNP